MQLQWQKEVKKRMEPGTPATGPTIARIWRGRTARHLADDYEHYNFHEGIEPLIEKAMGVQTFRIDRTEETEFVTISYWEDEASMARFTGGDPTAIHHLDRDAEFLLELPDRVEVLNLRFSHGQLGAQEPLG